MAHGTTLPASVREVILRSPRASVDPQGRSREGSAWK